LTHFWWVRHGPTHEKAFVGWRDVPADLSDAGLVSRVSNYLPKDAVVISSDLIRAKATANAIAGERNQLKPDPRLREFNFGDWDGLTFEEVSRRDDELSRKYWERPGDVKPPNGESLNEVANRVNACVEDLTSRFQGQHIVVVAHIGVIMTQIQKVSGGDAYRAMGHQIDNLSTTDLRYDRANWYQGVINHIP
jgi:broad specificity phosphatase PhoE